MTTVNSWRHSRACCPTPRPCSGPHRLAGDVAAFGPPRPAWLAAAMPSCKALRSPTGSASTGKRMSSTPVPCKPSRPQSKIRASRSCCRFTSSIARSCSSCARAPDQPALEDKSLLGHADLRGPQRPHDGDEDHEPYRNPTEGHLAVSHRVGPKGCPQQTQAARPRRTPHRTRETAPDRAGSRCGQGCVRYSSWVPVMAAPWGKEIAGKEIAGKEITRQGA